MDKKKECCVETSVMVITSLNISKGQNKFFKKQSKRIIEWYTRSILCLLENCSIVVMFLNWYASGKTFFSLFLRTKEDMSTQIIEG